MWKKIKGGEGMTLDEAKEYAKTMTYREAILNLARARSIPYRKATFIKIYELLDMIEPRAERIMTKEESEKYIKTKMCNDCSIRLGGGKCSDNCKVIEAIKALEQEPKMEQFAKWVATEIFDDNWEYNKAAFEELACRKLAKLGIVRAKGDEWELVEPLLEEGEG